MNEKHVLILGAGIAGITCAKTLQDHGYQVTVLEARQRIGGRLWNINGIDIGAGWLHNVKDNPLHIFCKQHLISTEFVDGDSTYIGGWKNLVLESTSSQKYSLKLWDKSIYSWQLIINMIKVLIDGYYQREADISLITVVVNICKFLGIDKIYYPYILWHANALIRDDWGAELARVSTKNFSKILNKYNVGDAIVSNGMGDIIEKLAFKLKILANTVVYRIEWSLKKPRVYTNQGIFAADKIVVTFPLGVLKRDAKLFFPALPTQKTISIQNLGYGSLTKIILLYKHVYWDKDQYTFALMPDYPDFGTPTQVVSLWKYNKIPALVIHIGGNIGRIIEGFNSSQTLNWCNSILSKRFKLPANPVMLYKSKWSKDPFSNGCYTFLPVGAKIDDIKQLAAPLNQNLFFAGEATSEDWATAHGAYLSGIREAYRIINDQ